MSFNDKSELIADWSLTKLRARYKELENGKDNKSIMVREGIMVELSKRGKRLKRG